MPGMLVSHQDTRHTKFVLLVLCEIYVFKLIDYPGNQYFSSIQKKDPGDSIFFHSLFVDFNTDTRFF